MKICKLALAFLVAIVPVAAHAQLSSIAFQQNGSPLGRGTTFNAGTGITCTLSGPIATCTASGGTIGGTVTATNIPYASGANTIADTQLSWDNTNKAITFTTTHQFNALTITDPNGFSMAMGYMGGSSGSVQIGSVSNNSLGFFLGNGSVIWEFNTGTNALIPLQNNTYNVGNGSGNNVATFWGTALKSDTSGSDLTILPPNNQNLQIGNGSNIIGINFTTGAAGSTNPTHYILHMADAADTNQSAGQEINNVLFDLSATRTWATGAIATQREFLIKAPTYAFAAASTITTAATLDISGAPIAGTNATITSSWALRVEGGPVAVAAGSGNGIDTATQGAMYVGQNNATNWVFGPGPASTSGAVTEYVFNVSSNTGQTASTEIPGVNFALNMTRQWATGAIATQREFLINAPTYAFASASTITLAATMAISGDPVAGTNATITEPVPLLVNNNAIGAVSTKGAAEGILIQNNTAATAGVTQQYSPMLVFDGQAWNSTSLASQDVRFAVQTTASTGASVSGSFVVSSSTNGSAYSNVFQVTNNGTVFLSNTLSGAAIWGTSFDQKNNANLPIGNTNATSITFGASHTSTTGAVTAFTFTSVANTGQTASTEIPGVNFNLSATRTWATGAIATQREFRIQPPTYAFAAASTITTAATVAIDGDPVAGTNATITESIPLLINNNGIGATTAIATSEGILLQNTTAAAAGAQQFAPMLVFDGQGWATTPVASQDVRYGIQMQPVQGAANPTVQIVYYHSINGAGFVNDVTINSFGNLIAQGSLFAGGSSTGVIINSTGIDRPNSAVLSVGSAGSGGLTNGVNIGRSAQSVNNNINSGTATLALAYGAASSGTHQYLTLTSPADTGQTASTEINGVNFNLSATRTWATGAITTQREFRIQPPTYAFAAASTITTAATMAIDGDPIAGTNATITESIPLLVSNNNIGAVSTFAAAEGVVLMNNTAAALGAQQWSPMLVFDAQGWQTNTSGSQDVRWAIQNQTIQGAAAPSAQLAFLESINGAAYAASGIVMSTAGTLQAVTVTATGQTRLSRTTINDANDANTTNNIHAWTAITAARVWNGTCVMGASSQANWINIKDESGNASGTNTITIQPSSGTIDGAASKVCVNSAFGSCRFYSNGTNCFTF